ncbi:hypothetical protein [Paenarthrobacter nicotinovorans]|uniref:hypothetical protein n=1 Tax=Paenarthrobacter nicotinovorans TaxID=29320 RepID=UPI000580034B|nr:hypothetical protein ANMWB30_08730 [Arthrobacter sp. MWB30]
MSVRTLDKELRTFFHTALGVWGGPARASDVFARQHGFGDAAAFTAWRLELMGQLEAGAVLSVAEFGRLLRVARIAVHDDYYGAGWEWIHVTPYSQEEAEQLLQRAETELQALGSQN